MLSYRGDNAGENLLGISVSSVVLVIACSATSIWNLAVKFSRKGCSSGRKRAGHYQDPDGCATEESEKACSCRLQRILILLLSATGSIISLNLAVNASPRALVIEKWLNFVTWLILDLHAVSMVNEHEYLRRFRQCIFGALSNLILFTAILTEISMLQFYKEQWTQSNVERLLLATQLSLPLALAFLYTTVPRRPDVYRNGKVVDRLYTTSLIGRLTFSWPTSILQAAVTNKFLDIEQLSELNYSIRTETLVGKLEQKLVGIIFKKAVRRKIAADINTKHLKTASERTLIEDKAETTQTSRSPPDKETEEIHQIAKQSTENLVGVDSYRVSLFACCIYKFPDALIKVVLAFGFLAFLIGWIPLLTGLVVPIFLMVVNAFAYKGYYTTQGVLMKVRDKKTVNLTEALQGIRQIKFSALEDVWQNRILKSRREELQAQWQVFKYENMLVSTWFLGPIVFASVALGTHAIIQGWLSPSIAFSAISIFDVLRNTLTVIPELMTNYSNAKISARRIEEYLTSAERKPQLDPGPTIMFRNAHIAWPTEYEKTDGQFSLQNLNFSFPDNELIIVCGKTGSGKSLLLASILGEAELRSGQLQVPRRSPMIERFDGQAHLDNWYLAGSYAFVPQIPWIEDGTIQGNILFGLPLNLSRYKKAISACALETDLGLLPDGDLTAIGINGVNLSGGQKWRISLARALYSRASILILDDVFSAVDAHVGRQLFQEALTGDLGQGRTRVLVTHHVALCISKAKFVVLLGERGLIHAGTVNELRESGNLEAVFDQDVGRQQNETGGGEQNRELKTDDACKRSDAEELKQASTLPENENKLKRFMEEERQERGTIKYKVYAGYMKASGGYAHWVLVLLAFIAFLAATLGRSWWITVWTRSYQDKGTTGLATFRPQVRLQHETHQTRVEQTDGNLWFYLSIYLAWSLGMCILVAVRYYVICLGSIRASERLFEKMTYRILRAPLRWLDTVPTGRIMNRFTSDFNLIDSNISANLAFMLHNVMQVIAVSLAGAFVSPWMILFSLVLLWISTYYARYYIYGARDVKRLESSYKSPIFETFGAVIQGLGTIRAFDKVDIYVQRAVRKIDEHAQTSWHMWLFSCWMDLRLGIIGGVFAIAIAALVCVHGVDASLAGFALSFTIEYAVALTWALRQYTNVELDMNAVERIVEFSNNPIESQGGIAAPAAWPMAGNLEVVDLVVGYAPDSPPVLQGLNFRIDSHQRVGVVGRTGAGKSSLALALFRVLNAREGRIVIDGLDISKLRLQDLRSRLAIIPQDPVLFAGTVRSNLDIDGQYTDAELCDALKQVHLVPVANDIDDPSPATSPSQSANTKAIKFTADNIRLHLDSPVSESGLNFSQGQRQLLCLARAIIRRPKILVLDEATSAVDMETDALIQRSIRERFHDCTLVVIAHRLSTIADFDRILVLQDGRQVEWGRPRDLLLMTNTTRKEGECDQETLPGVGRGRGVFQSLVEESGERDVLKNIILQGGR